jgi:hypothetical protein
MRSMLTPTGPIIMSSAEWCDMPGMTLRIESPRAVGICMPGIFMESALVVAGAIFIESMCPRAESTCIAWPVSGIGIGIDIVSGFGGDVFAFGDLVVVFFDFFPLLLLAGVFLDFAAVGPVFFF